MKQIGKLDWYNENKGYGLVKLLKEENVFIHKKECTHINLWTKFVVISEINFNQIKSRNEGKGVYPVTSRNLDEVSNIISDQKSIIFIEIVKSLGIEEFEKYIYREIQKLLIIEDDTSFIDIFNWLLRLNLLGNRNFNGLLENVSKLILQKTSEKYRNLFWLSEIIESANSTSILRIINRFSLLTDNIDNLINAEFRYERKKTLSGCYPSKLYIIDIVTRLPEEILEKMFKHSDLFERKLIYNYLLEAFTDCNEIEQLSKIFNATYFVSGDQDSILENLKTKLTENNSLLKDLNSVKTFVSNSKSASKTFDTILPTLSEATQELLFEEWLKNTFHWIDHQLLVNKMNSNPLFYKEVISRKYRLDSFVIVKEILSFLGDIDSVDKYEDAVKIIEKSGSGHFDDLLKNSKGNFKVILKLNYFDNYFVFPADLENYITKVCLELGYEKYAVESIIRAAFPERRIDYFEIEGKNKRWSVDFIENCNINALGKVAKLLAKELLAIKTPKAFSIKQSHSATELASFIFCNASYVNIRSYEVDYRDNLDIFNGQELHSKMKLLDFISMYNSSGSEDFISENNSVQSILLRIIQAKIIHCGHDNQSIYFKSPQGKLSGSPDYIFEDKEKIQFAVEEKFTYRDREEKTHLFENHKMQALSYLYGLSQFNFSNVYIIYWYLKRGGKEGEIETFDIFEVNKSSQNKAWLLQTFSQLEQLNNKEEMSFDPININYNKCIKCSIYSYCEHKKGKLKSIKIKR